MLKCIYCNEQEFESGSGSEEHVILSSLGGRKASRNICCVTCNNRLGGEIDHDLSDQLSFLSTMLDITTGRNQSAPVKKGIVSHGGSLLDVGPGGEFNLSKAEVKIQPVGDGRDSISITAGDEPQALRILEQVLRKYGKSLDDFQSLEAKSVTSYVPIIHQRLSLGGELHFRSVAKMLLTYTATLVSPDRLRGGSFRKVIEYINGHYPDYAGVNFDFVTSFPETEVLGEVNHRIFFAASNQSRLAVGFLELYGNLRFSAILTDLWDGRSLLKGYVVDPIGGRSVNLDLEMSEEIFDCLNNRAPDMVAIDSSIEKIVETFQKRQTSQRIHEIARSVVERDTSSTGDFISREKFESMCKEAALELMRFLHRQDSVKDIDLKR